MTAATPPFPEAALRGLLAAAVAAWAREPAAGDAQSAGGAPRRLYVDAFAGAELQFGTGVLREPSEPTRAQAAVRAIDEACAGHASCPTAVFVEEDPAHLQRIYGELEDAIGGERLRATRDFGSLAAGEASLVEAPFAAVAGEVARFAAGGQSFVWLAPATARAMPWTAVEPLLALPGATLLIRFPHADFEKQSRHAGSLADLPGFARRIVEGCSSLLGDGKHAWLSAWRTDAKNGDAVALPGVLERFRALLATAAGERMVRPVELQSAGGARAWCFLVTADAAVALVVSGDGGGEAAVRADSGVVDETAVQVDSSAAGDGVPQERASKPRPAARRGRASAKRAPAPSEPTSVVDVEDEVVAAAPVVAPTNPSAEGADSPPVPVVEPSPVPIAEPPPSPIAETSPEPSVEPVTASPPLHVVESPPAPIVDPSVAAPVAVPDRDPSVAEVLDLFSDAPVQPAATARPEVALAAEVEARFGSRTAPWGDVAASFAADGVTLDTLKAALRHLRRGGRAIYTALRIDADEIVFPSEPVAPAKANRRPKTPEDDGLFGSGE